MNSSVESSVSLQMAALLNKQREAYLSEAYPAASVRKDRISRVIGLLVDHQYELCEAIEADYGRRAVETTRMQEIMTPISSLKYARKNVDKWMRPEYRSSSFPFNLLGGKSFVRHVPVGVVGNLSPWNFPVALSLAPLGGILAAGNRAMLKPSEFTPQTSELLSKLISERFDDTEIAVVLGEADVAAQFSSLPFDHLLFTGSTAVGSKILAAAAPNLVPTTLELGGKSPVIVADDANISEVAQKVAFAKTSNSGQICIAPDYVLISSHRRAEFVEAYCDAVKRMFPEGEGSPYIANIITKKHRTRLESLLEDAERAGNRVVSIFNGDNSLSDERAMGPAVVEIDNAQCRIMEEEIFGPLLPVMSVDDVDDAINYVTKGERPLALYLFTHANLIVDQVVDNVVCGGMVVNDLLMHYLQDDLPFGGVGGSGIGAYHGVEGFKTFSHAKSVFKAPKFDTTKLLRPPYGFLYKRMLDHEISK